MQTAIVAVSLACLVTGAAAHPISLQMAYISEADDGLTRQSVDALARPEAVRNLPPPSEYSVQADAPADAPAHKRATWRHHRHRANRETAQASPAPAHAADRKSDRPWAMRKLIAFTNWWNGWSERNLHTAVLDVHLDRPAHHDA